MRKTRLMWLALAVGACVFGADIVLDGKLDEPQWQAAEEHADFQKFKSGNQSMEMPKTSFRVINDESNLYLGIYCKEPDMSALVAPQQKYPWNSDLIEIFMSPSCRQDEFYQFVVSAGNVRWCEYYGEGGNIRPDPGFAPIWDSAVYKGEDFWSMEVRLPLAGFYQTRNTQWQSTWLFNITRDRFPGGRYSVTWSPLINRNQESSLYRKLGGFPMRKQEDDLFIENVTADIASQTKDGCQGTLNFKIYSAKSGEHKLSFNGTTHSIKLENGVNKFALPCNFEQSTGRNYMLFKVDDGTTIGRTFPILLKYEPVTVKLKTPGYSNTFYPGQDRSQVVGTVYLKNAEKATVTFEGEGLKKQEKVFNKGKLQYEFSFKSTGIGPNGAMLTVQTAGDKYQLKINAPDPIKHQMAWIENGYLVVNGKPTFVRTIEGAESGFGTGTRFKEFFATERDTFKLNNDTFKRVALEPFRLIKGIEPETVLDQPPSQKLLDAIAQVIEKNRDRDFCYYFLTDEPECRNISPVYLEYLYKYVKSLDPFHPISTCSREPERFVNCADYITTHPYWNPYFDGHGKRQLTRPLSDIPRFFQGWQAYDKASALVPQVFSYRNFSNRISDYPTLYEIESSCWASIACGATGIEAYHFHDFGDRAVLYEGMRYLMPCLERLDAFLVTPDKKTLPSPESTKAAVFTVGKDKLLILVNLSAEAVEMQAPFKGMVEFCGNRVFNGKVKLEAYQTALFTTKKMDDGLPSRDDFIALINKKEQERLGTKNILLERGFDINLSESRRHNNYGTNDWVLSKLFDGNYMIQAWQMPAWNESWVEFGFPKFTPEFTRLVLHGLNLDLAKVKYWKDGEWRELAQKAVVECSQYKVEYKCSEQIRTVKLRLEFPKAGGKSYEMYEMEAYNDNAPQVSNAEVEAQNELLLSKDNVLWRQTGENIVTGPKGWDVRRIKVFANDEGKLTVLGEKHSKDFSPATAIDFPLSKEYPWLVCRLKDVKDNNSSTYHAWCILGPMIGAYKQDFSPIPGIYTFNLSEIEKWPEKKSYLAIYAYSQEMVFDEISLVKKMECMLSGKFTDNGIVVTAQLAKPAESVSVRICHMCYPLTGELNLKPADEKRQVWTGTFTFDNPLQYKKTTVFKSGQLELRADILGGDIPVPVFAKLYQQYPINN